MLVFHTYVISAFVFSSGMETTEAATVPSEAAAEPAASTNGSALTVLIAQESVAGNDRGSHSPVDRGGEETRVVGGARRGPTDENSGARRLVHRPKRYAIILRRVAKPPGHRIMALLINQESGRASDNASTIFFLKKKTCSSISFSAFKIASRDMHGCGCIT